jgi:MarR family 2-MHQ and catechol resistance regulon transcriptional repressor
MKPIDSRGQSPRRIKGTQAWLALWRVTRGIETHARQSVESDGLCLSDFAVLEALLHKGPLSVGELGRLVLLTSGSITASIDRLERDGLVERATTTADRRSRIVHLTRAGRDLIDERYATHERDMEQPFATLTDTEMRTLVRILTKLRPDQDELAA